MQHLKQRNRRSNIKLDTSEEFRSVCENIHCEKITPEYQLLSNELGVKIHKSLSDMPDEYRIALLMNVYDGLSYRSISELIQVPIGTVRSRIHRGRELILNDIGSTAL